MLVAGVLAGLLAGCASGPPDTDQGAGPQSPSANPSTSPSTGPSSSPAPSPDEAADGRPVFRFDVAFRADDPQEVVVRYGESSSCPREQVDAEVEESAQEVVVTLTALPGGSGLCTADFAPRDVTLTLEQPLGDRQVVDGATGTDVAVAVGTPPGPAGSPVPLPE